MRRVGILLLLAAGAGFYFRKDLKRWIDKQTWQAPDGRNLGQVLADTFEDIYSGDIFGDGRENHVDRLNQLQDQGITQNTDEGVYLNKPLVEVDVGTTQYLAQLECSIAVRDYGMDPALKPECEADLVRRGYYGFSSDGVRMGVTLHEIRQTGAPLNVVTDDSFDTSDSGNWTEITEARG